MVAVLDNDFEVMRLWYMFLLQEEPCSHQHVKTTSKNQISVISVCDIGRVFFGSEKTVAGP